MALPMEGRNLDPPVLPPFVLSSGPSEQEDEELRIDCRQHKCARQFWLARSGLPAADEATHCFKVQRGDNAIKDLGPKPCFIDTPRGPYVIPSLENRKACKIYQISISCF